MDLWTALIARLEAQVARTEVTLTKTKEQLKGAHEARARQTELPLGVKTK